MSITRALATLKSMKRELETNLNTKRFFIGINIGESGKETMIADMDAKALSAHIQSNYDTANNMLVRYLAIKQKINLSNAVTKVIVNNAEMTVADAIIMKTTLPERERFVAQLKKSHQEFQANFEKFKSKFDDRVDSIFKVQLPAEGLTGQEQTKLRDSVRDQQMKLVGPTVNDPIGLSKLIEAGEKEIAFLKTELDYVLSTSNTTTMIEVPA